MLSKRGILIKRRKVDFEVIKFGQLATIEKIGWELKDADIKPNLEKKLESYIKQALIIANNTE